MVNLPIFDWFWNIKFNSSLIGNLHPFPKIAHALVASPQFIRFLKSYSAISKFWILIDLPMIFDGAWVYPKRKQKSERRKINCFNWIKYIYFPLLKFKFKSFQTSLLIEINFPDSSYTISRIVERFSHLTKRLLLLDDNSLLIFELIRILFNSEKE